MLSTPLLALVAALQLGDGSGTEAPNRAAPARTADASEFVGAARELDVPRPFAASPAIRIDGRIDADEWADAAVLRGFTQYDPLEGVEASEETEVRVLVSDDAIYFGITAHDRSGGIRATLSERDGFGRSDDYVRVILDTFDDQRRAYVFTVNPYGVQGDGVWVEGGGGRRGDPIDWSPDFLWESDGTVSAEAYEVELRIPLKSLRFPEADVQDWGLQVVRQIQRTGYSQSWAPLTSEQANRLAQAGRLTGLRDLERGMFLEINPVVTGTVQGAWDSDLSRLTRDPSTGDFGLNVSYGITSNLTLDGTYNPDFSQVEADAGQIAVNERFALFFPEKRPFFLEGADIFSMPKQLVYTRSIVNPIGAAKVSGKVGGFSMAYLGAVDESSGDLGDPVVNLVRVKRDVGGSSTVGLVYTDRTTSGDVFNRVVGTDARLVLGGRYTLTLLAAGSADRRSGADTDWGSLVSASFNRASRNFSLSASFEDVADDFRAGSGFIRRVGSTQLQARTGYTFRGDRGAFLERWSPSVEIQSYWARDDFWAGGGPEEWEAQLTLSGSLRNNIGGFLSYQRTTFDFAPDRYEGLYLQSDGGEPEAFRPGQENFSGLDAVRLRSWIGAWERVRGSLGASWSETPLFTSGLAADLGESWSGDLGLTVYATGQLSTEVGARHVRIYRKRDGSRYSSATIPRLSGRYQASRSLFVRAIGEYSSQERGDLLDPDTGSPILACSSSCTPRAGSDRHDFRLEGLVGYEPSPGTVFYLGYTRQMRDTGAFRFRDVTSRADGLFVKLSYRFRM